MSKTFFLNCSNVEGEVAPSLVRLIIRDNDIDYLNNICLFLNLLELEGCAWDSSSSLIMRLNTTFFIDKGRDKEIEYYPLVYEGKVYEYWEGGESWNMVMRLDSTRGLWLCFFEGKDIKVTTNLGYFPTPDSYVSRLLKTDSYAYHKYQIEEKKYITRNLECYVHLNFNSQADKYKPEDIPEELKIKIGKKYITYCHQILLLINELEVTNCWWRSEVIQGEINNFLPQPNSVKWGVFLNNKGEMHLQFRLTSTVVIKTQIFNMNYEFAL